MNIRLILFYFVAISTNIFIWLKYFGLSSLQNFSKKSEKIKESDWQKIFLTLEADSTILIGALIAIVITHFLRQNQDSNAIYKKLRAQTFSERNLPLDRVEGISSEIKKDTPVVEAIKCKEEKNNVKTSHTSLNGVEQSIENVELRSSKSELNMREAKRGKQTESSNLGDEVVDKVSVAPTKASILRKNACRKNLSRSQKSLKKTGSNTIKKLIRQVISEKQNLSGTDANKPIDQACEEATSKEQPKFHGIEAINTLLEHVFQNLPPTLTHSTEPATVSSEKSSDLEPNTKEISNNDANTVPKKKHVKIRNPIASDIVTYSLAKGSAAGHRRKVKTEKHLQRPHKHDALPKTATSTDSKQNYPTLYNDNFEHFRSGIPRLNYKESEESDISENGSEEVDVTDFSDNKQSEKCYAPKFAARGTKNHQNPTAAPNTVKSARAARPLPERSSKTTAQITREKHMLRSSKREISHKTAAAFGSKQKYPPLYNDNFENFQSRIPRILDAESEEYVENENGLEDTEVIGFPVDQQCNISYAPKFAKGTINRQKSMDTPKTVEYSRAAKPNVYNKVKTLPSKPVVERSSYAAAQVRRSPLITSPASGNTSRNVVAATKSWKRPIIPPRATPARGTTFMQAAPAPRAYPNYLRTKSRLDLAKAKAKENECADQEPKVRGILSNTSPMASPIKSENCKMNRTVTKMPERSLNSTTPTKLRPGYKTQRSFNRLTPASVANEMNAAGDMLGTATEDRGKIKIAAKSSDIEPERNLENVGARKLPRKGNLLPAPRNFKKKESMEKETEDEINSESVINIAENETLQNAGKSPRPNKIAAAKMCAPRNQTMQKTDKSPRYIKLKSANAYPPRNQFLQKVDKTPGNIMPVKADAYSPKKQALQKADKPHRSTQPTSVDVCSAQSETLAKADISMPDSSLANKPASALSARPLANKADLEATSETSVCSVMAGLKFSEMDLMNEIAVSLKAAHKERDEDVSATEDANTEFVQQSNLSLCKGGPFESTSDKVERSRYATEDNILKSDSEDHMELGNEDLAEQQREHLDTHEIEGSQDNKIQTDESTSSIHGIVGDLLYEISIPGDQPQTEADEENYQL